MHSLDEFIRQLYQPSVFKVESWCQLVKSEDGDGLVVFAEKMPPTTICRDRQSENVSFVTFGSSRFMGIILKLSPWVEGRPMWRVCLGDSGDLVIDCHNARFALDVVKAAADWVGV